MSHRIALSLAFVAICTSARSIAAEPKAKGQQSLSNLSLEVMALRTLHEFQMTPAQLAAMRKLAADTASEATQRDDGQGSGKLRQALTDLRAALIRGDDNRIEQLDDRLGDQLNADDTDLDDEVTITPAARRAAGRLLQALSRKQLSEYLQTNREEIPDPQSRLVAALGQVLKLDDEEWDDLAAEVKDELSWQLGGLDPTRSNFVGERIEAYLKTVRGLSEAELQKQRPDLEKAARLFVGQVPAAVVQHNFVEHTLAELLSNPRLGAALAARVKR